MASKIYLGWAEVEEATEYVAAKILEDKYKPDFIVAIARGGLIPGVRLSHILKVPMRSIHLSFYDEYNRRLEAPRIIVPLHSDVEVRGKNILLVDDIADTGLTLKRAKEYLEGLGVSQIKIATLAKKPRSITDPDYYLFITEKWVVFPWEKEPLFLLSGKISEEKREIRASGDGVLLSFPFFTAQSENDPRAAKTIFVIM